MDISRNLKLAMKEYEIKLSDIQRILFGEVPAHFFLEVIFRTAIIYLILMFSMRIMGKRMSSQLSRNEMAAVSSLAAAVGIPLMNPDRGLLPAAIIAVVIITYQVLVAKKASTNKKFEALTQDRYTILVKDGVLDLKSMLLTRISRDRIFAQLRSQALSHLGQVERLYFEADGTFSFVKAKEPKPGLSILPKWDHQFEQCIHQKSSNLVCNNCGNQEQYADEKYRCQNCANILWITAVTIQQ